MPHLVRGQVQCFVQILESHLKYLQVWESELDRLPPCDRSSSEKPHSSPHGGAAPRSSLNICKNVFAFFSFYLNFDCSWDCSAPSKLFLPFLSLSRLLHFPRITRDVVSFSKRQDYKGDTSLTSNEDRGKFRENYVPVETPLHLQCSQEAANLTSV